MKFANVTSLRYYDSHILESSVDARVDGSKSRVHNREDDVMLKSTIVYRIKVVTTESLNFRIAGRERDE